MAGPLRPATDARGTRPTQIGDAHERVDTSRCPRVPRPTRRDPKPVTPTTPRTCARDPLTLLPVRHQSHAGLSTHGQAARLPGVRERESVYGIDAPPPLDWEQPSLP